MRRSLRGFAVTQPDVTGGAILRETLPRVRGIELPPVLRAVTHVAHGWQLDTGIRRRYSDVLVHPTRVVRSPSGVASVTLKQ
jgi:hypothetical protein